MSLRRVALLLALGCGREAYDVADLQIDVDAPLPAGAETLHVCVAGAGELSQGAGNGRLAFTGLPANTAAVVTLDVADADGVMLGAAGPITVDATTPYVVAPFRVGSEAPCVDPGQPAPAGSDTWLLALRFEEAP